MLTKSEFDTIQKLRKEVNDATNAYLIYLSSKGFLSGGTDYKKRVQLQQACIDANLNLDNYLKAITEKRGA
ncbi:hypothetical protein [Providencia phage PSTCR7]|uniref:Uncharacterized protein n=1 Tax=Providencia phage PSTCR7 TaxID=2783549 RepID=A0A7S9SWC9_9CAUD|nr:hypothetical protein PQD10_gp35 [Providencia phage PSTCR7]QPI18487.1 hypothetical protein [Providencia phage PSTCR7]